MFGDLIARDEFLVSKPLGGADEEGVPLSGWTTGEPARGTWGSPSTRDLRLAERIDQQLDAVVATETVLKAGWRVAGLRGRDYIVTHVRPLVTHHRVFLREHSG